MFSAILGIAATLCAAPGTVGIFAGVEWLVVLGACVNVGSILYEVLSGRQKSLLFDALIALGGLLLSPVFSVPWWFGLCAALCIESLVLGLIGIPFDITLLKSAVHTQKKALTEENQKSNSKFSWEKAFFACAAAFIVAGTLSIYLHYQCMDLESQVAVQADTISELQSQIDAVEANRDFYKTESEKYKKQVSEYRPKAQFLDNRIALIVDGDYTYAYHTYDCYIFKNSTYFYAYNIEAAEARGYSPCKICH